MSRQAGPHAQKRSVECADYAGLHAQASAQAQLGPHWQLGPHPQARSGALALWLQQLDFLDWVGFWSV